MDVYKTWLSFILVFSVLCLNDSAPVTKSYGNSNDFVDTLLWNLKRQGYLELYSEPIWLQPLSITSRIWIYDIALWGLSDMYRGGDCTLQMGRDAAVLEVNFSVNDATLTAKHDTSLGVLNLTGVIDMEIVHLDITAISEVPFFDGPPRLKSLTVTRMSGLRVTRISGFSFLLNWEAHTVGNFVIHRFKKDLTKSIEKSLSILFQDQLVTYKLPFKG